MSAAFLVGDGRADGRIPDEVVPQSGDAIVASWVLDVSPARRLIASAGVGAVAPDRADALLGAVHVVEIDERLALLIGPPAGRARMIGRAIGAYWPRESRQTLAELILAAASNHPDGAVQSRAATSLIFADFVLSVARDATVADSGLMVLTIQGTIADDRSLWAVRASEERYRNLIHHLPVALLQVDAREIGEVYEELRRGGVTDLVAHAKDHPELIHAANESVRVTEANANAVRLFGAADVADLIGPVGYLFAVSRDSALRVMDARFKGRRSHAEVMKMRTLDGRLLDIAITVTYPRPPERLDVTLISLEDITERLRTEVQLRQLQADYSRAARISMLGELATSIAHEVNQPLSAIVTNAETSLRWLSRADPNLAKVGQLTARIATSARLASDIVQRIRAMAAPRAPERVLVDLNGIVEEALIFVRHEVETRSIELSVRLDPGLPAVHGDRVQLQQVIVNLLINAVQALGQREGGRIELCTASGADGTIRFAIHDDGPGIAPENLDRIFGSFFTTRADGMGIGLAICQSIIAAHGGAIEASNHADGGALFRFSLPAVEG